eukprot:554149-Ditylum_brightwellii.AAC.1
MRFPSPLKCIDQIWQGSIFSVARYYRSRSSHLLPGQLQLVYMESSLVVLPDWVHTNLLR